MPTTISNLPQVQASFIHAVGADILSRLRFIVAQGSATPLDISGISFSAIYKRSANSLGRVLVASTENGLLLNGGANGLLQWNVPGKRTSISQSAWASCNVEPGQYLMWIIAVGDGKLVNLNEKAGPASVSFVPNGE